MFLLASLGRSKVLLGDSGGAWGARGSPQGLLGDPLGGSEPSLGGPWGTLAQPEAPSESTLGKQAALRNHRFYRIKLCILAFGRGFGGT